MSHPSTASATKPRADQLDALRGALIEVLGAERRLRGRDQRASHDEVLTNAQLWALSTLGDGEKTAGEIAVSTLMNPATTTVMLDHLEQRGVLERRRSTEDRRVCLVSLTAKGREIVEHRREQSQLLWRERLGDADAGELEAAVRVMRMIVELLDAH